MGSERQKLFADPQSPYFIRDAKVVALNPPVVQGLGQTDGFEFQLQADAMTSRTALAEVKEKSSLKHLKTVTSTPFVPMEPMILHSLKSNTTHKKHWL